MFSVTPWATPNTQKSICSLRGAGLGPGRVVRERGASFHPRLNSSHCVWCVCLTEGKEWLRCLSVISAFLDDRRGQLELSQIRGLAAQVPALAMCVQVEPRLPGHQAEIPALQLPSGLTPQLSTPGHAVPVFSMRRTILDPTAPTPLLSAEQFSVTTTSICLSNSTSQIQRSQA